MRRKTSQEQIHLVLLDGLNDTDICCGRGKGFLNHPGNKEFQKVLQSNLERYASADTKNGKSKVVSAIVSELRANGSRFVKKDKASGKWYDIGVSLAHEKTGHAIRDHILNRSKRQAKQVIEKKSSQPKQVQKKKQTDLVRTAEEVKSIAVADFVMEASAQIEEVEELTKGDLLNLQPEGAFFSLDAPTFCAPSKPEQAVLISSLPVMTPTSLPISASWYLNGLNPNEALTTEKQTPDRIHSLHEKEPNLSVISICKSSLPLPDLPKHEVLEVCPLLSEYEIPEDDDNTFSSTSICPSDWL